MLPGEPRRPFGQRRHFLGPSDYRGAVFGIRPSNLSVETLSALGSRPRSYIPGDLPYAFDGAELDLATIEGHEWDTSVTSLTGNVVLWPRAFVVVANRNIFAKLTAEQREILRRAGREALAPAIRRLRIEERDEGGILCRRRRLRLVQATQPELAALRAAVSARLRDARAERRDPRANPTDRVDEAANAAGASGRMRSPSARQAATTPLDGTWEMTADARYGIDAGRYRLVLRHGHWRFSHLSTPKWGGSGVFAVRGEDTRSGSTPKTGAMRSTAGTSFARP